MERQTPGFGDRLLPLHIELGIVMLLFRYSNVKLQAVAEFIDSERAVYEDEHDNLVAFALKCTFKRYRFARRLRELADPLIEKHIHEMSRMIGGGRSGPMSASDLQAFAESTARSSEIQMFFETFFMHGSILCDEIAHLLLYFYGEQRGLKMNGHRTLLKNFPAYAKAKSLIHTAELITRAEFLERELCDFRDKQIVHDFNPRKTRSLCFNASTKDIGLSAGFLYPKPTDTYVTSKGWRELSGTLDEYVWSVLDLIRANRTVCRFSARQS